MWVISNDILDIIDCSHPKDDMLSNDFIFILVVVFTYQVTIKKYNTLNFFLMVYSWLTVSNSFKLSYLQKQKWNSIYNWLFKII